MRTYRLATALAVLVACSSDNNTTPDASSDANVGPDSNVDSSQPDGSQPDTSTPIDAGDDGALPYITCSAPAIIDAVHKATSPVLATSITGGKVVVAWGETTGNTLKARFHDGSTWQTEHAFTASAATGSLMGKLGADGLGNSILEWLGYGGGTSYAAVMSSSGTWGTESSFPMGSWTWETTLAAGGGALIFTDSSNVKTSIYDTGSSAWSALDLRQAGLFSYAYIASNAAGKMAAMWTKASGVGAHQTDIAIASYGGTWSSVVTQTVGTGGNGASAGGLGVGVYSNGDPVVAWYDAPPNNAKLYVQRYQIGTSSWSSPEEAFAGTLSGQNLQMFIDDADRMTLFFVDASTGHATVVRNTGSGWSAPTDLGPQLTDVGRPVMDRATGNLAVAVNVNGQYGVRRITATGTTWEAPVMSTLTTGQYFGLAFDGAHAVIAASQGAPADVEVSFCK